jgi:dihydrodipicolinate synthase/N-acetylneuraminate lyase
MVEMADIISPAGVVLNLKAGSSKRQVLKELSAHAAAMVEIDPQRLLDALMERQWDRARSIRDALRPFEELRQEEGADNNQRAANNVPAVKHGMDYVGLHGGPVRAPLTELSAADKERAERYIDEINETLDT